MWYNERQDNRIISYRNWRLELEELPLEEQLNKIAHDWAYVPRSMHYLTPDDPDTWPTPWELIHDNIYCDLSVCLGMFYTAILLGKTDIEKARLLVYNSKSNWINLSSFEDGKYILNWNQREVVNTEHVPAQEELKYVYSVEDIPALKKEFGR